MKKQTAKLSWHTGKRKVKDLVPCNYNPRILSEEQKQQLTKSLQKFNLAEIPAINTDNTIIAGHQRITALILLGRKCRVMELDPKYCDVIVKRYEKYTGKKAVIL